MKPRLARFLGALALKPGEKGAIRCADLSADGVALVANLVSKAEAQRHGTKRREGRENPKEARRLNVERAMRNTLRAGNNPRDHFEEWSAKYRYSRRHLANILKDLPEIT